MILKVVEVNFVLPSDYDVQPICARCRQTFDHRLQGHRHVARPEGSGEPLSQRGIQLVLTDGHHMASNVLILRIGCVQRVDAGRYHVHAPPRVGEQLLPVARILDILSAELEDLAVCARHASRGVRPVC